jgi:NAD(P)-dependent dehydrogenase (short-subunit alcohol dehydrogenase family)
VAADVADSAAVEAMVAHTEAELGPVTILVNNAGVSWQGTLDTYDREQVARMRQVNVDGVIPDCGDTDSSAAPSALSMAPLSHWTTVGFCNGCPGGAARGMSQGLRVLV